MPGNSHTGVSLTSEDSAANSCLTSKDWEKGDQARSRVQGRQRERKRRGREAVVQGSKAVWFDAAV